MSPWTSALGISRGARKNVGQQESTLQALELDLDLLGTMIPLELGGEKAS